MNWCPVFIVKKIQKCYNLNSLWEHCKGGFIMASGSGNGLWWLLMWLLLTLLGIGNSYYDINDNYSDNSSYYDYSDGIVEEVYEPFLVQTGLIARTPRGRIVTAEGYLHFGLVKPEN